LNLIKNKNNNNLNEIENSKKKKIKKKLSNNSNNILTDEDSNADGVSKTCKIYFFIILIFLNNILNQININFSKEKLK